MEALDLARLQFAVTTVYHFFFVPLTLGLSILVAMMHTQWVRTGDETYKKMTKFWGKLFLINFAMGVVTGIVQEFQFGMNWSEYSRFVGDIFGAPLAIEALMAFFLESTFLGLWIFGWDKLPKRIHLATIWIAAIGANISAFWILVANSFMQNPVGYTMVDGRATMTDFGALITNPNVILQYPHVVLGGFSTGAFFVMGVSAYHLLRRKDNAVMFKRSFMIAMVFGFFAILGTMFMGHLQGQNMADYQPMKLAAAEGLWEDADPAGLSMFQIGDETNRESVVNITIPSLLSFLTYDTPNGMVRGINNLNIEYQAQFADKYDEAYAQQYGLTEVDYVPTAIWLTYWSFRAMVGSGMLMFLLILVGAWFGWRGTLAKRSFYLWMMVFGIALPYLANSTGWLLTEFGRQPWIVFGEMRIEEAISPNVGVPELWITLIGFTLIYGVLMLADVWLLWKYGSADSELAQATPQPALDAQPAVSY
jgi:cytochrome d ubiquinol oxidase subunit I